MLVGRICVGMQSICRYAEYALVCGFFAGICFFMQSMCLYAENALVCQVCFAEDEPLSRVCAGMCYVLFVLVWRVCAVMLILASTQSIFW